VRLAQMMGPDAAAKHSAQFEAQANSRMAARQLQMLGGYKVVAF